MPSTYLDCQKIQKDIVEYFHILAAHPIYTNGCPWDEYSPSIWQSYINTILDCLQNRKYHKAIIDNLLLLTPSKGSHMDKLEALLKALLTNGLKISPKKCQLFRTNLQYMGNEIFIQNKRVCVQPLKSRLKVIHKLQPHSTVKRCRSFVGIANFLSMFCPELQKLLNQIYDLTRKGKHSFG